MAEKYSSGTTPMPNDTIRIIEQKILTALDNGGGGGGGAGQSSFSGTGSPVGNVFPSVATAQYFDTTIPSQPIVWYWANSTWTRYIG